MRLWKFTALDTWFFRDGIPLNQGETGVVNPRTVFPPHVNTLQGAIRTTLARERGWTFENGAWPTELGTPDDLGYLRLRGPYLFWKGEPLFQAPLVLFGRQSEKGSGDEARTDWEITRLVPGPSCESDLGGVRLPRPVRAIRGAQPLQVWLTRAGLAAALAGGVPEPVEMRYSKDMWKEEYRVGIARLRSTRTVADGQLFSTIHVRPKDLQLGVLVDGIPEDWQKPGLRSVHLGGEGRAALVGVSDAPEDMLPTIPELWPKNGRVFFTISLITPGFYEDTAKAIREGPPGVPGKCVSACIAKVQQVGGWDLRNQLPRPLKPVVPAGSTWFFETDESALERIVELHGKTRSAYGDGQMVIGTWEEDL